MVAPPPTLPSRYTFAPVAQALPAPPRIHEVPLSPELLVPVRPVVPAPADDPAARFEAAVIGRIGSQRYHMWFGSNVRIVPAGRQIVLAVASESYQGWLEHTFGPAVREAAAELGDVAVRFAVDAELFEDAPKPAPAKAAPAAPEPKPTFPKTAPPGGGRVWPTSWSGRATAWPTPPP
jgi:hypothetical protein